MHCIFKRQGFDVVITITILSKGNADRQTQRQKHRQKDLHKHTHTRLMTPKWCGLYVYLNGIIHNIPMKN